MSGRDVDIDYLHGLFDSAEILDGIRQGKDQMDDLEDHVDGSRSTLHRKMKFLRNRNLVRRDDDTFGLTPKGEAVLDGLSEFTHHIKTVEELEPFLEHVGETVDELSRLSGSTVYTPKDGRPHYPVKLLIESVEEASYVRGFSPVVTPTYVTVFHRRITQGMRAEIVLENPLVRVLEDEYPDKLSETVETGDFELRAYDGSIPHGLVLTDEKLLIGAYSHSSLVALVENTSEEATEWERERFESYFAESEAKYP